MLADLMEASSAWRAIIKDGAHKTVTYLDVHCINITPSLEAIAWSLESVTSQQRTNHDGVSAKSTSTGVHASRLEESQNRKDLCQTVADGNHRR